MGWAEGLQKAIDYMEEHLLDDISIEDIALEANASSFHFQRTFSVLTDMSIGEYLRKRRLTLAAQELTTSDEKVIDIALKYGYDTPEAFAKAFRRQHGLTPTDARKKAGQLNAYNRLVIQVTLKGAEPMKYKIIEKESFTAAGIRKEFSMENGENFKGIPKMWKQVHEDGINKILFTLNEHALGICVDKRGETGEPKMDYWIAAECKGGKPEGLEELIIPASKWAVFEVHGEMPDAMQNTWKQIFSEWFPSNPYEHAGTPELEVYNDDDPYSPDCYSEIWIPVK